VDGAFLQAMAGFVARGSGRWGNQECVRGDTLRFADRQNRALGPKFMPSDGWDRGGTLSVNNVSCLARLQGGQHRVVQDENLFDAWRLVRMGSARL